MLLGLMMTEREQEIEKGRTLSFFLEDKFTFLVVVLVLATTSILSSLY